MFALNGNVTFKYFIGTYFVKAKNFNEGKE